MNKLADLMCEYDVTMAYTIDDDGIHMSMKGDEFCIADLENPEQLRVSGYQGIRDLQLSTFNDCVEAVRRCPDSQAIVDLVHEIDRRHEAGRLPMEKDNWWLLTCVINQWKRDRDCGE